jgi:hypothetical protein
MLKEYYPAENSQHLASSQQLDDTQAPEEPAVPDAEDLCINFWDPGGATTSSRSSHWQHWHSALEG